MKGDYGHTPLSEHELGFLHDERPETVYVGTGQYGALPLTPGAEEALSAWTTVVAPTGEVVAALERDGRRQVAIIHVTC